MLISLLKKYECLVATAESCTGGAIAKAFTDQAGSSAWYDQGWVTYSAHGKHQQLGVDRSLLQDSMVSQEVAIAMAIGALSRSQAQLSISVTGVAGPSGGSQQTPVGCCWFGFAIAKQLALKLGDPKDLEAQLVAFASLSKLPIQAWSLVANPDLRQERGQLHLAVCCYFPGDRAAIRASAVQLPFQLLPALFEVAESQN